MAAATTTNTQGHQMDEEMDQAKDPMEPFYNIHTRAQKLPSLVEAVDLYLSTISDFYTRAQQDPSFSKDAPWRGEMMVKECCDLHYKEKDKWGIAPKDRAIYIIGRMIRSHCMTMFPKYKKVFLTKVFTQMAFYDSGITLSIECAKALLEGCTDAALFIVHGKWLLTSYTEGDKAMDSFRRALELDSTKKFSAMRGIHRAQLALGKMEEAEATITLVAMESPMAYGKFLEEHKHDYRGAVEAYSRYFYKGLYKIIEIFKKHPEVFTFEEKLACFDRCLLDVAEAGYFAASKGEDVPHKDPHKASMLDFSSFGYHNYVWTPRSEFMEAREKWLENEPNVPSTVIRMQKTHDHLCWSMYGMGKILQSINAPEHLTDWCFLTAIIARTYAKGENEPCLQEIKRSSNVIKLRHKIANHYSGMTSLIYDKNIAPILGPRPEILIDDEDMDAAEKNLTFNKMLLSLNAAGAMTGAEARGLLSLSKRYMDSLLPK